MSKQQLIDTLFTSLARGEEKLYPDAKILPDFPRSIQLNSYSCGSRSVFVILKYFNKRCTYESIERQLSTDEDGTSPSDIKRVFKKYGLKVTTKAKMTIRDLKNAINKCSPVLISICSDEHYIVIFGFNRTHIFAMNSSLDSSEDGVGSLKCAVPLSEFKDYWDRWGIIVSNK